MYVRSWGSVLRAFISTSFWTSPEIALTWFNRQPVEEANILDDNVSKDNGSLAESLAEIDDKMKGVSPERVARVVSTTIRKDTKIIRALKNATDFRCQFPNCGQRIVTRSGGYYIEVAHIKPVSQNGKSILGNLVVLCPNHHKEFDYDDLEIVGQTTGRIAGKLNGKAFDIDLKYFD